MDLVDVDRVPTQPPQGVVDLLVDTRRARVTKRLAIPRWAEVRPGDWRIIVSSIASSSPIVGQSGCRKLMLRRAPDRRAAMTSRKGSTLRNRPCDANSACNSTQAHLPVAASRAQTRMARNITRPLGFSRATGRSSRSYMRHPAGRGLPPAFCRLSESQMPRESRTLRQGRPAGHFGAGHTALKRLDWERLGHHADHALSPAIANYSQLHRKSGGVSRGCLAKLCVMRAARRDATWPKAGPRDTAMSGFVCQGWPRVCEHARRAAERLNRN